MTKGYAGTGGWLSTHVLDTATGNPAAGLRIDLVRLNGDRREQVMTVTTNEDGRSDGPVLSGAAFTPGRYELLFHVGDYLRARGLDLPDPAFLDEVPVRFGIADAERHYHVPLLISPYAYSTYRGS